MYAKIFTSMFQGTLRGNSNGLLVFTNLLAHADKSGVVDIHPRAIAEEVGLTIAAVKETIAMLESPDDESRSPEEQGRRIVRLDEHRAWGWVIVNHQKYRDIRNEEDRREQNRASQERFRNKNKQVSQSKPNSNLSSARSAHTDTDTNTEPAFAPSSSASKPKTKPKPPELPPSREMEKIVAQCIPDGFTTENPPATEINTIASERLAYLRALKAAQST